MSVHVQAQDGPAIRNPTQRTQVRLMKCYVEIDGLLVVSIFALCWSLASTIGTPLEPRNVARAFAGMLTTAELPAIRFHDLRHTAAMLLLAQGVAGLCLCAWLYRPSNRSTISSMR